MNTYQFLLISLFVIMTGCSTTKELLTNNQSESCKVSVNNTGFINIPYYQKINLSTKNSLNIIVDKLDEKNAAYLVLESSEKSFLTITNEHSTQKIIMPEMLYKQYYRQIKTNTDYQINYFQDLININCSSS